MDHCISCSEGLAWKTIHNTVPVTKELYVTGLFLISNNINAND